MSKPMLALTVHQPYAWALVHGYKPVENRSWRPASDIDWVLVHAGKKVAEEEDYAAARYLVGQRGGYMPPADGIQLGAIVGAVQIVDAMVLADYEAKHGATPWAVGPICWVVGKKVAFPEPIVCRGFQGLWPVPEEHRALVRLQWRKARA